jgi:hypothetical protein
VSGAFYIKSFVDNEDGITTRAIFRGRIYTRTSRESLLQSIMVSNFGQRPASCPSTLTPFRISIPEAQVEELTTLLKLSKLGPRTYENQLTDGRYGLSRDWLANAKAEWEKWDW